MITGWQLLEPARRRGVTFVRALVRFGDHAREVEVDKLEVVLEAQIYQTDFTLDDPEVENMKFDFVVWAADGRMWCRGIRDGLAELSWRWSTPESWLRAHGAVVPPVPALRDEIVGIVDRMPLDQLERARDAVRDIVIESRIGPRSQFEEIEDKLQQFELEAMRDEVADAIEKTVALPGVVGLEGLPVSVADRLQQLADAPGGRILLDVGDLTEQELELIADSEIPAELRWNSDEIPPLQRVDLLRNFLGLVGPDAALMKAKWSLMRITALAMEERGIAIDEIAAEVGETPAVLQRWLDYVVRDVSLDRLAAVYHAVAERAGLWPLEWLIGGKPGGDE